MPYSLTMIVREWRRYLPAALAVAFSDLLITVQVGLLLGALAVLSLPIDHSAADVWVASPGVLSLEMGYPIPESWPRLRSWRLRLSSFPRNSHAWGGQVFTTNTGPDSGARASPAVGHPRFVSARPRDERLGEEPVSDRRSSPA